MNTHFLVTEYSSFVVPLVFKLAFKLCTVSSKSPFIMKVRGKEKEKKTAMCKCKGTIFSKLQSWLFKFILRLRFKSYKTHGLHLSCQHDFNAREEKEEENNKANEKLVCVTCEQNRGSNTPKQQVNP